MAARVGRLDWLTATRGRLSARNRAELLRQATVSQAEEVAWRLRGGRAGRAAIDLDRVRAPDSALAKAAEEACAEIASRALVNHSHRSFWFGTALGAADGVTHDPELLYVACMLHDLGLDPAHRPGDGSCFTLVGAEAALGLDAERCRAAAAAIAVHMNMRVTLDDGAEGYLLTAGAQADVMGRRRGEIADATMEGILDRHPRADMKRQFAELMGAHGASAPRTRAGFYFKLGARRAIERAPYSE
jgi:hypothetical protein